jgi:cell shape-determining protein MreC
MQYLPATTPVSPGDYVVTSGTIASGYPSLFPRGIPIGQVTSVQEEGSYKDVNVQPLANLHDLETVQVLTYASGSAPARAARAAAGMLPGANPAATKGQLASVGTGG